MDTYMHQTMVSIVSLEKIEITRSQELMLSKVGLKFLKKKRLFEGLKLPFWGLNFVEFWCWGLIFGGQGGTQAPGPPLDPPLEVLAIVALTQYLRQNILDKYSKILLIKKNVFLQSM